MEHLEHLSTASVGGQAGRATATAAPTVAVPAADGAGTSGAGGSSGRRSRNHRRLVAGAAALVVVALVGVLLTRDDGAAGGGRTAAAPVTTSPTPHRAAAPDAATPATTAPAGDGEASPATPAAAASATPAGPALAPDAATSPTSPTSPADGPSVFDAWLQGNDRLLRELATAPVADFLAARTPDERGEWTSVDCEGAAGSSYCAWTHPDAQLVLRSIPAAAEADGGPAVREAFFIAPPGGVAVWPFTTAQQAARTQAGVDGGHQPWMLDPATVAGSYAAAELGWHDAVVEETAPGSYLVTDPASGTRAQLQLARPGRQDPTGIWAITRSGSVSTG